MKIHIEIGQYEFIEQEVESVEEAQSLYHEVKRAFKSGEGLPKKEWDKVVEDVLQRQLSGDPGILDEMNAYQKSFVDETKRGFSRIKNHAQN